MSIISFDRLADAKQIIKDGIKSYNRYAGHDMKEAIWYYVNHTTYSKTQILERMVKCTSDYFAPMPLEEYINPVLRGMIDQAAENQRNALIQGLDSDLDEQSNIIIYEEELNQLESLKHRDTRRLAFTFLVYAKHLGYSDIFECNAELCKLAWRYDYNPKQRNVTGIHKGSSRVNGTMTTRRLQELTQAKIIWYHAEPNMRYKVNTNQKPSHFKCEILILQDDGTAAINIHDLTADSLILWYDRYCGYGNIVDCSLCGAPVYRSSNSLKYCPKCAVKAKRGLSA